MRGSGRLIRATVAALVTISLCAPPSSAAPAKRRPSPGARAVAPKLSNTEVLGRQLALNSQISGESLTATCRRASFKLLAVALNMNYDLLRLPKGEYETSEQYAARQSAAFDALNGQEHVFCQPLDDNEDLAFSYNADDQSFEGSFSTNQNVWRDVKRLGSYRSRTRIGIAATVKSSLEQEYNVALDLPSGLKGCLSSASSYSTNYGFRVPYALGGAPSLKANGYLAFVGALVSPFIDHEERSGSPTLDDPNDVYEASLTVHFRPSRLAIVDGAGNQVWTCKPGTSAPNMAATPLGNATSWVSIADYPSSALREQAQGAVTVSVSVGIDGSAVGCTVVTSSGRADLDQATCDVLRRRAKFSPATDGEGYPKSGSWTKRVVWAL